MLKLPKKLKNKSYKRFNTRVKNHYTKKVDNNFKKYHLTFAKTYMKQIIERYLI